MKDNENNVLKVRVANSDTNSGKSNGYRLIYYAVKNDGTIYLLTIYHKKDKENITNKEIQELILKYCMWGRTVRCKNLTVSDISKKYVIITIGTTAWNKNRVDRRETSYRDVASFLFKHKDNNQVGF